MSYVFKVQNMIYVFRSPKKYIIKNIVNKIDNKKNIVANGDINFGGVLTTGSGLIFATGTPDSRIYAYDGQGNQVWFDQAESAGSAPPISFEHYSCQFILS